MPASAPFDFTHSPENNLLLTCAKAESRPGSIAELMSPDLDWSYFISTACEHGVLPLVYHRLSASCSDGIPSKIVDSLDKYFYLNSSRNLYQTETLLELLRQLHSQNVSAIPYKGPVLCYRAYGNLSFREFGDLDILVRPEDILKARAILDKCGYRATIEMTPKQEKAFLASNHAYSMVRDDDKTVVELHWRFTPRYFTHELDYDRIWTRSTTLSLNGTQVPVLCPEDLFVVLSSHGTKHCWDRLLYICDIARLICAYPQTNWETVISRAKKSGGLRMLNTAMFSAHKLLDVELPDRIKVEIERDTAAQSLAAEIGERLFENKKVTGELARVPFHLKARERLTDKVLYSILFFITPTMEDFKTFQLPAPLFPLYTFTRPLRLFLLSIRRKYLPQYEPA